MQETGNKSNQPYSLSIRFHTDGFSFYICNPQSDKHYQHIDCAVADKTALAENLRQKLEIWATASTHKFTVVSALFNSPACFVPLELFQKEDKELHYELTCPHAPEHTIHYNILPHLEVAHLFSVPQAVEEILLQYFPAIHFHAQNSMVLERTAAHAPIADGKILYAYFYNQRVYVFHFCDKKLVFANEFTVSTSQDVLYYVLNVWKMLQLDRKTDCCALIQPEHAPEHAAEELKHYIYKVQGIDLRSWFDQAPLTQIKEIPFDILSLLLNGF